MAAESEDYRLPSADSSCHALSEAYKEELIANARLLQQTLAQFNIEVVVGDINMGTSITCFEFHVAPGVRMQRIKHLSKNLMAALRADSIEVLAPIPGKSTVGIQVPNLFKAQVITQEASESTEPTTLPLMSDTTESNFTYTCPICAMDCSVVESLTGRNIICPNCRQEFYASPISQSSTAPSRIRYTLPAKLPFFKSGRKQLLAARLEELVAAGEFDEAFRQELDCMATDLGLTQSDVNELQQEQLNKEFQPIKLRIQSVLMLTDADEKDIHRLEKKYGSKLVLGINAEILRASYMMATKGRLPMPIQTGLMLGESEIVYHMTRTTWHQTRASNYSFAGTSISIPIIRGVRYRIASYDVARTEAMTPLSSGMLYVTSKRLLFVGESRNATIIVSRIINLQIFKDALQIEKSAGKSDLFSMKAEEAVYITTMIGLIRQLGC